MMTYEAANEWLKKRANLPTGKTSAQIAADIPEKVRQQSFFSARVAEARILQKLRGVSDAYSRGEINLAQARGQLKDYLVWSEGYRPGGGLKNLASTARLNLILEQNARMAAAVGQYQAGRDPDIEERFPCWRYLGSTALMPREDHAQLAGKVFRKDDPIWRRIFPPSKFGCKCSVEDCDDPPSDPPKIEDDPSGFRFDPVEAFNFSLEKIDDQPIKDIVEEQVKKRFPEQATANEPPSVVPDGTPVSEAVVIKANDVGVRQSIEHVLRVIDSVHGDGELLRGTEINNARTGAGVLGVCRRQMTSWANGDVKMSISIARLGPYKEFTAVHELGHFLDVSGLGMRNWIPGSTLGTELSGWKQAIENSSAYQQLTQKLAGMPKRSPGAKHLEYLLNSEELFARSYAQYVASKSGDRVLLDQLEKLRTSQYGIGYASQWADDDFAPIAKEFDNLFKRKGWQK